MGIKSRFFRVAVEGGTTDGRTIERGWLEQMAASYKPDTYGARVNMEHIRGFTPDPPFNAYGDVIALKTEEIELEVGGKKEKKLALFAQIDANDQLVAINKKGQKVYTSIEIEPNFRGTGQCYLMGLAVTDSPASLGTEALSFAAFKPMFDARKQSPGNIFTAATEADIQLETPADTTDKVDSFFDQLAARLGFTKTGASPGGQAQQQPVVPPVAPPSPEAAGGIFSAAQKTELVALFSAFAQDQEAARKTSFEKLSASITALTAKLDQTPANGFTQRTPATGGAEAELTDC